ncbi:MAG: hypothetical protein WAN74_03745 [Thermoplasmata archaeon]
MVGSLMAATLSIGGWEFLTILLLIFGLFMILAGAFTAYFGSGRSRTIGVGLIVFGLVVGILGAYFYSTGTHLLGTLIWESFLVLIAAIIGALVAIGIFLVAIMKS